MIEADFQRYYGLDLRAECYGPASTGVRRLLALTVNLPPESALARSFPPLRPENGHHRPSPGRVGDWGELASIAAMQG